MSDILIAALTFTLAFLLGSVPFAVIVSRLMGLADPRSYGSGNPGATNVLRSGNRGAALFTLLGDAAKGWLAVLIAHTADLAPAGLSAAAMGVFLGHVFSVFLRFKGGKGVATAAGVLLGIDWRIGLGTLAVWLLVAAVTRYSSLAAICGALVAPLLAHFISGHAYWTATILGLSVVLIWRHEGNIRKLVAGGESRIGKRA